jgi:RNA polymerase sigma factor (sigma-70 family)
MPDSPFDFSTEDVLQSTHADATSGVQELRTDSPEAFQTWLKRIAEHRLLDIIRRERTLKRGGNRPRVKQLDAAARSSAIDLLATLSADGGRPDSAVEANEAIGHLLQLIDELPDDARFAVQSHFLQQKSLAVIAREMDRTCEAVRHLVYRAKRRLRAKMGNTSLWLDKK